MVAALLIEARESVALATPGDARVIVGDAALEAAGYDPTVYHAVVPSEGMRGGKVNKNKRIYGTPGAVAAHHMSLVKRAREGYVGGEKGHPGDADNPTHPTDAIKILDGSVVAHEDGSNTTRCLVGILRTTAGNDVFTMWKAGKPTGLSLRGICSAQEHTITKDSPYAPMNPGNVGETVELRALRSLDTYDAVFDPSFGTFFADPAGVAATESVVSDGDTPEVHAAAERLRASGAVIESTTSRPRAAQESHMEIKDIKALEAAFPELVKQLRADAATQAATEATTAATAQIAVERERIVALETAKADTEGRLKATEGALAQVRNDLARAAIVGEIRKAVEAWQVGKPGAPVISALVVSQAEGGSFANATEAVAAAESALRVAKDVAAAMASTPAPSAADRAGLAGTVDATESGTPKAPRPVNLLDLFATQTATA